MTEMNKIIYTGNPYSQEIYILWRWRIIDRNYAGTLFIIKDYGKLPRE